MFAGRLAGRVHVLRQLNLAGGGIQPGQHVGGPAVVQHLGHDEDLVTARVNDRRAGNA
jgi:hypothetical protein